MWGYSKSYTVDVAAITFSSIGTLGFPEIRNPFFTPIIRLKVIIPKKEDFNLNYLKEVINISSFSNNASGIPNINSNAVKDIDLVITTNISEQHKIGQLFSNLDNLITLHQRK